MDDYRESGLERTIFSSVSGVLTGVRTNTPPDTFCCPGSNRLKRLNALLVMEIEFCAENPQGQVTSGIFNVLFTNLTSIGRHY